jgi:protein O-mannosyl-transferase
LTRGAAALVLPHIWLIVGLLAWMAVCYAPALPGPYQFDDRIGVAVDPAAASLSVWSQAPASHVRPLLKASFALSHGLGQWLGHVPLGHRLGNLAIHLATVVVLWRLGVQLAVTCLPRIAARDAALGAAIAAALFGLHPLATEAVSYISGRSMSLGTLLACASLIAWMQARSRGPLAWGAVSLLLAALATFCRETVIFSLPLLVVVWELLRADLAASGRRRMPAALLAMLPFAALAAAALLWMLWHDRYAGLLRMSWWIARVHGSDASLLTGLGYFGAAASLLRYPSIDPDVSAAAISASTRLLASLVVGAALWSAWRWRARQPQWLLAAAWVLGWLLPLYAWPLRHDVVSERHFYPALWGVAWAVGLTLAPALRGPVANAASASVLAVRGVLLVTLLVLSSLTIVRNHDYRSEVLLWESAVRSAPDRLRVLNNLGVAYMEAGRWDEATDVLTRTFELDPRDSVVAWNLTAARRRDLRTLNEPVLMEWPALADEAGAARR